MDIFEFAMQMEKDGEAYYKDLAEKCTFEGLKQILNLLAQDEVGHYQAFSLLKDNTDTDFTGSEVLNSAKNVFAEIKEKESPIDLGMPEVEMYKKAIEIEKKSEEFYKEKAGEVDNPKAKEILLKIAEDEKKHQFLLEHMVNFLERPQSWVENAEFNHLDSY